MNKQSNIQVDDLILVYEDVNDTWKERHFCRFLLNGKVEVYAKGSTSKDNYGTAVYEVWKLPSIK